MSVVLEHIIKNLTNPVVIGNTDLKIEGLCFDSRAAKPGYMFFAVKGTKTDGHKYIDTAIKNGAVAVVCEETQNQTYKDTVLIKVNNSAEAMGIIASEFYGNPSSKLKLVGVTGTNGKTTVATLLYELFIKLGENTGLLSTVANFINDREIVATHTTPDSISLNKLLAEMVEQKCQYCFIEVSSHALAQNRVSGLNFAGGVFTNITHDHLDYHNTFAEYLKVKKQFFDMLAKNAFALTNVDDKNGMVMLQNTKAEKLTYSLQSVADYKAKIVETIINGSLVSINGVEMWTLLPGLFNVYNVLSVYAVASILNIEKEEILTKLSTLKSVKGRFDIVTGKGITAIVDYAHTPDALENVLKTINKIITNEQEIITVVGAGGDRDKTKRPIMAQMSAKYSNRVILTSDNPRSENPEHILDDMEQGLNEEQKNIMLRITDREQAIKTSVMLAKKNDIILIAGKGHESYQEIDGVKTHFDDKEIISELLN